MSNLSISPLGRVPSRKKKRHNEAKRSVDTPAEKFARDLRTALGRREAKERATIGLYSLRTKDSPFGVPFCAASDSIALEAAKQLLPLADVYRVGSFCLLDGKCLSLSRPSIVLDNKVN